MTGPAFPYRGVRWAAGIAEVAARLAQHAGRRVEVVDLQPFAREDAWVLRTQLARLRAGTVRHWAGVPHAADAWRLASLPESAQRRGELESRTLLWSPQAHGAPRPRLADSGLPWRPRGPVLFVAGDLWQRLDHELLGVHYGKMLRWDEAAWAAHPEGDGWVEAPRARGLAAYTGCVNSAPIPVPAGALRALEAMDEVSLSGWMAVARARGWEDAADVRDPEVPRAGPDELRAGQLPVNFDWLAARCREAGLAVWHACAATGEIVQAVAGGGQRALPIDEAARLLRDAAVDPGAFAAAAEGASLPPVTLLGLLRAASHDPKAVEPCLAGLPGQLARQGPAVRAQWREALARTWRNAVPFTWATQALRGFADAAAVCGDPALVAAACEALRERGAPAAEDLCREAHALALAGRLEEAVRAAGAPGLPPEEIHDVLRARMNDWAAPWRTPARSADGLLCLEPLGLHHADALAWQGRDEQTALMTGLPHLKDARGAGTWIFGHAAANPATYAAVHAVHGVVGYGELRLVEDMGFLALWVGLDHQGRGLGGTIVRLLRDRGLEGGLRYIFTSAFDDNVRSLRALRAAGMHDMHARVRAPNDDRVFLCLAAGGSSPRDEEAALRRYMAKVEGAYPIHFPHLESEERTNEAALQPA